MRHLINQPVTIIRTITSSSDLQFNRGHTFRNLLSSQVSQGKHNLFQRSPDLISGHALYTRLCEDMNLWVTISQRLAEEHIFYNENARSRMAYFYQALPMTVIFIRTSNSYPIIKCNMNPKSHNRLSHATRTSNLTSDCHMQQEPQITQQTVACNKNLQSHVRLSHAT
jgi:hypothetical protein